MIIDDHMDSLLHDKRDTDCGILDKVEGRGYSILLGGNIDLDNRTKMDLEYVLCNLTFHHLI